MSNLFGSKHLKALRDNYRPAFGVAVLLLLSFMGNAQVFPPPSTSYGTRINRVAIDSVLYGPTGCGAPTDSSFLFSQGFGQGQKLRKFALYYDSCGHHEYVWDPNLQAWHIADSSSGGGSGTVTSVIISNDSVYYTTSSGKTFVYLAITQPDSTIKYVTPTQLATKEPTIAAPNSPDKYWNGYKQFVALNADSITEGASNKFFHGSDTTNLSNLIVNKVTNSGGAKILGSGNTSSMPAASAGPGLYYNTDSGFFQYSNGSTWSSVVSVMYVRNAGAAGLNTVFELNDSIMGKKLVQGTNITLIQNPDSSITINASGGGASPGTPTAKVGRNAVVGSATTYQRSDAAPALDMAQSYNLSGSDTLSKSPVISTLPQGSRVMTDPTTDTLTTQAEIVHQPVLVATAAALPTNTYSNGTAGVGATLTATANGALTVDGVAIAAGNRVLVWNEATQSHNGIYIVTQPGTGSTPYILTRGGYSSIPANMIAGSTVSVQTGTVYGGATFEQLTSGTITIGTTNLTYAVQNVRTGADINVSVAGLMSLVNHGVGAGGCTNCSITFDAQGREVGYASGTATSAYYTPEQFGGKPNDTTVDNSAAINTCIDSASIAKGTCLLSAGTYWVRNSYADTATVYLPTGIHMLSNVTLSGQGSTTIIKSLPPASSATFAPIADPFTWSTNWSFFSIVNFDSAVSGATIQNLQVNGNLLRQINKDVRYSSTHISPYKNPQEGTTTPNVQTDGIRIYKAPNNTIYNVTVDSITGYGIHVIQGHQTNIIRSTVTVNGNGSEFDDSASDGGLNECAGSLVQQCLFTNSFSDNIRLRASFISIDANEISYAQPNINHGVANFAGIYSESDIPSGVLGNRFTNNYIHDNSAFGIDQNMVDTTKYNYGGQSNFIEGNFVSYNGAGGIQDALPMTVIVGNTLLNEGKTSAGFIDSVSQCKCGVQVISTAFYTDIKNNNFVDTRKIMSGGALTGGSNPYMTFAGNNAKGMSLVNNSVPTWYTGFPYNTGYGNTWVDTSGVTHSDFGKDGAGGLHLAPTQGTNGSLPQPVYVDDNSTDGQLYVNYLSNGSNLRRAYIGGQSQNSVDFALVIDEQGAFYGSGAGSTKGREWSIMDMFGIPRAVIGGDSTHDFVVGYSTVTPYTTYTLKVAPPSIALANSPDIDAYGTASGTTNFWFNSIYRGTLYPGATGTQQYSAVFLGLNHNAANSNVIGGAAVSVGNYGAYLQSSGNATAGNNVGVYGLADSALRNTGIWGDATFRQSSSSSAWSLGIGASALSPAGITTGVYATMSAAAIATPSLSSVYYGDNSTQNVDLVSLWHNGVQRFALDSLGKEDLLQVPDSVATPTGGCLFRDATTGYVRTTPCGTAGVTPGYVYGFSVQGDANYTVASTDEVLFFNTTLTANRTITLPNPSGLAKRHIKLIANNIFGGSFQWTITTVSGTANIYLNSQTGATSVATNISGTTDLYTDGTSWYGTIISVP